MSKENTIETIEKARLWIFLGLSFALALIPQLIFFLNSSYYDGEGQMRDSTSFLLAYSMLTPTIAVLFTRMFTREGLALTGENSLKLGLDLKKTTILVLAAAIFLPWLTRELGILMDGVLFPGSIDLAKVDKEIRPILWMIPMVGLGNSIMLSFGGLGEELGWRGYMMPKLEKIFGPVKSVVLGGIIWGAWHYVGICFGHNFGLDYWGAPWIGMLVFTVFTIFENAFLTLLTKKSNSVWPAAFAHAVNNSGTSILAFMVNEKCLPEVESRFGVISMLPMAVIGLVCLIILSKTGTRNKEKPS